MNFSRLSLGLLAAAGATIAGGAIAQSAIVFPPFPDPGGEQNNYPTEGDYVEDGYHPADTYSGVECKQKDGGHGSTNYGYGGGYYNDSQGTTEVSCPMANHNDPYQKWIWSDVHVTNSQEGSAAWCELKKTAPAYGGWAEYSSGKVYTEGYGAHAQQLKLHPVPGGYTPSSHVYVDCEIPSGGYVGNYNQYSESYEHYKENNTVYGDDYFEDYAEYSSSNYANYAGKPTSAGWDSCSYLGETVEHGDWLNGDTLTCECNDGDWQNCVAL